MATLFMNVVLYMFQGSRFRFPPPRWIGSFAPSSPHHLLFVFPLPSLPCLCVAFSFCLLFFESLLSLPVAMHMRLVSLPYSRSPSFSFSLPLSLFLSFSLALRPATPTTHRGGEHTPGPTQPPPNHPTADTTRVRRGLGGRQPRNIYTYIYFFPMAVSRLSLAEVFY